MDKTYQSQQSEDEIYKMWEEKGYFTPKIGSNKKPFTILMPPPNANDPLHVGHALYVVEDILCRWHRMKGDPTLFLPGTDHAGIETQYVFEKQLAKQGKSRFDFDRERLYKMINEFVEKNRGIAKKQMKKLGFSLDWTREKYTLDPNVLETVFETFRKLHQDGLIYRSDGIVNYCTHCGTAFSELEVNHIERDDFLYWLSYGSIKIATTRPETIFADVAVAVNPKDKRYKKLVGKKAILPILNKELPIITDELVDMEFGSGALKITPGHDATDFEIGKKHKLKTIKVIDTAGKMINLPKRYLGLSVKQARKAVLADLEKTGKLIKTEPLKHSIGVCYRCKNVIEPMTTPQWFIKIESLAKPALRVVKQGEIKIVPLRFKKLYLQWMENIRDWNISRQVVWGPRIPAWYCLPCNPDIIITFINKKKQKVSGTFKDLKSQHSFSEIKKGLQTLTAPKNAVYSISDKPCKKCGGKNVLQETDTFDTWFSSGQWPLVTLGFPKSPDFKYFYPTSVLDTMWDILFFWVARMIMLGIYRAKKIPFKVAHMHSRVVDKKGQKMSKSRGNVVNPIEMIEKYGADALRMALVFNAAPGSDICLGDDNVLAMRKFANKIWNASRFVLTTLAQSEISKYRNIEISTSLTKADKEIIKTLNQTIKSVTENLESFRFHSAAQTLYHFFWHNFCDRYIEISKSQLQKAKTEKEKGATQQILLHVLLTSLKLLHPFMPFVTETIYQMLPGRPKDALIIEDWPKS